MESMNSCCGLIISCSRIPVPLRGISVDVQVKGFVADVSARLKYKNVEEKAVEAVFVFPMDNDSAVYSFEATVEGKTIVAELQEKEQAHKTYDEAISQGQEAFLLEEDQSSRDVFTCSVGNLPPGQEAEVKLSFVQELPVEVDGAVRFVLPAVLNPRYTPEEHKESVTVNIPRLPADQIPYTLDLNAQFHSAYGISKIQSNCDISPLAFTDADKLSATVSLASGHKFERDVEFLVYYKEENKPSVTIEAGHPDSSQGTVMADSVAMLNFYPSFPDMKEKSNCGEFIFLIDRSGSMWDQMSAEPNAPRRIDSAKETLVLLLKSLPLNCYFNIYSFGSEFSSIFTESAQYTQGTMEAAVTLVNEMDANMGGTEILEPLKKINKTGGWPGHPRQLFVFSDGEVGNTREVIAEVRRNSHNHRCFTFGIGEGASTALLKGIARAASGTCEFITGKERMQSKVLQTLKCSLQPTVKEISLDWTLPPGVEATLLSGAPSAIFQGQRSIVYAKLMGKVDDGAEGEVCLKYKFKDEIFSNVLRLQLTPDKTERPMIHRLAAKVLISQLENSDDSGSDVVKKRILETSVQSGVISSLTAYVAVNKETKNPVQGPPMRRDIPLYGVPQMMMCCMPAPKMMSCSMGVVEMEDNICYESMLDSAEICTPDIAICKFPAPTPTPEMPPLPTPEELTPAAKMEKDFFKLISLQNADGSWNLNAEFASILESSEEELGNKICHLNVDSSLWVTVLAITWLHAFRAEQRDEWELLEEKALDWITSKKASSLSDCVQAANELLSSSVDGKVFGV